MELNAFWAAVLRRWYLVLAALLCAAAVTTFAVRQIGPEYKAEGSVLLFPPTTTVVRGTTTETLGNPYLMLSGLSQARDIVIHSLTSKLARDEFAKKYPDASFEVTPDFTTSGPIIVVDVSAPTSAGAVAGLNRVLARIPDTLVDLQSDLKLADNAYITARGLTADTKPEIVRKAQIRSGIVVAAATLALSLLLIGLLDGLLSARRSRNQPRGRRALQETPEPEPRANGRVARPREGRAAPDRDRPMAARR